MILAVGYHIHHMGALQTPWQFFFLFPRNFIQMSANWRSPTRSARNDTLLEGSSKLRLTGAVRHLHVPPADTGCVGFDRAISICRHASDTDWWNIYDPKSTSESTNGCYTGVTSRRGAQLRDRCQWHPQTGSCSRWGSETSADPVTPLRRALVDDGIWPSGGSRGRLSVLRWAVQHHAVTSCV